MYVIIALKHLTIVNLMKLALYEHRSQMFAKNFNENVNYEMSEIMPN